MRRNQKVTQGDRVERMERHGEREVGKWGRERTKNNVINRKVIVNKKREQGIQIQTNERGTSACSVIQGCWVGSRKVGAGLMEDTHGDKACSYRDTKTRRQQATKLWTTASWETVKVSPAGCVFNHTPPQAEASQCYAW